MRERGARYREIADALQISQTHAHRLVNGRPGDQRWKDANREHVRRRDREWSRQHRQSGAFGRCSGCGEGLSVGNTSGTCRACVHKAAAQRATDAIALWVAGAAVATIETSLGYRRGSLHVVFAQLRAAGVPIPRRHPTSRNDAVQWSDPLPDEPIVVPAGARKRNSTS